MRPFRHVERRHRGQSEGRKRQAHACDPDAECAGKRSVEEARNGTEAEEGDAPESHDPAALTLLHLELEPARGVRVRSALAEPRDDEEHEAEREPG